MRVHALKRFSTSLARPAQTAKRLRFHVQTAAALMLGQDHRHEGRTLMPEREATRPLSVESEGREKLAQCRADVRCVPPEAMCCPRERRIEHVV